MYGSCTITPHSTKWGIDYVITLTQSYLTREIGVILQTLLQVRAASSHMVMEELRMDDSWVAPWLILVMLNFFHCLRKYILCCALDVMELFTSHLRSWVRVAPRKWMRDKRQVHRSWWRLTGRVISSWGGWKWAVMISVPTETSASSAVPWSCTAGEFIGRSRSSWRRRTNPSWNSPGSTAQLWPAWCWRQRRFWMCWTLGGTTQQRRDDGD